MALPDTTAPQPAKILDFTRLQLFTPAPNVQNVRSKLSFGFRDGNARITVFTNDPNDTTNKGIIYAGFSPEMFDIFLTLFERVIRSPDEIKHSIDCFTTRYEDNKPTNEKILNAQVWFGKDASKQVWISVTANGRPQIKFTFHVSEWHKFYRPDGTEMDAGEGSAIAAMAHLNLLRQIYGNMITHYLQNPPPPRERMTEPARPRAQGFDSDSTGQNGGLSFDNDVPF